MRRAGKTSFLHQCRADLLAAGRSANRLVYYIDVLLLRDVVERHKVANVTALRWLVRRLLSSQ